MTVLTGDGKCLIAWDMGCGPTWAYDPLGKPIKEKYLGACEVWRSADGGVAVNVGETSAEAFLDDQVENGSVVTYWIMEKMKTGGLRQVGPSVDVELPQARLYDDDTPPSPPNELKARRKSGGNELSWLASCDDESGVLAYFVYSANEHQPDSILWLEDPLERTPYGEDDGTEDYAPLGEVPFTAISQARYKWLDRTPDRKKPYIMRALDCELNLSDPTGRVDPWTGLPPATPGKEREPVEPVVPESEGRVNFIPNPRFHVNVLDGWSTNPVDDFTREVSPPVTLPTVVDAAARYTAPNITGDVRHWWTDTLWGIEPETDYVLSFWLYHPSASGMRVCVNWPASTAYVYGAFAQIESSSVANPTVITTAEPHGFTDGQVVIIGAHAGSTPSLNGTHVATVTGPSTFTVPVNVTVGGTGGTVRNGTSEADSAFVRRFFVGRSPEYPGYPLYASAEVNMNQYPSGDDVWMTGFMFEPVATASAVPNPSAAVDCSGWIYGSDASLSRVTSVPGTTIPSPAVAAFAVEQNLANDYVAFFGMDGPEPFPEGSVAGDALHWQVDVSPGADSESSQHHVLLQWYSGENFVSASNVYPYAAAGDGWERLAGDVEIPATCDAVQMVVNSYRPGTEGTAYCTQAYLFGNYADGDTAAWKWSGTAHDSVSEQA
jgi:hypothetical protein